MIRLVFIVNREPFRIEIIGREIFYSDRKWKRSVRLIPKDEDFISKVRMSRNAIPNWVIGLFDLSESELEEYEGAKDEKDLASICLRDAKMRGAVLVKMEESA